MKLRAALTGFALFLGCAAPVPEFREAHRGALEDSLRVFLETYRDGVERMAWDEVTALYSTEPGFAWIEDGRIAYESADSIAEALRSLGGMFTNARLDFREPRVQALAPGLGLIAARFDQTLAGPGDARFTFSGAISAVVQHTPAGWRFVSGHTSTLQTR